MSSITRTCWGATSVENTPETRTVLIPFFYRLQDPTRYIWQTFSCCQILLEVPASQYWFMDLYVVVQSERLELRTDRKCLN